MTDTTTPRPPLTVRTPVSEHPTVAVYPDVRDPGYVVLEWRIAESVHREVLHRGDLVAALGAARQPAPVDGETTTEWGVRWSPDCVEPFPSEMDACDAMGADLDDSGALVQRDAGPWREVSRG